MQFWIIGFSSFAGLLLGLIFGWDAREFVMKHGKKRTYPYGENPNDIRPEDVPDVIPADKEERF